MYSSTSSPKYLKYQTTEYPNVRYCAAKYAPALIKVLDTSPFHLTYGLLSEWPQFLTYPKMSVVTRYP